MTNTFFKIHMYLGCCCTDHANLIKNIFKLTFCSMDVHLAAFGGCSCMTCIANRMKMVSATQPAVSMIIDIMNNLNVLFARVTPRSELLLWSSVVPSTDGLISKALIRPIAFESVLALSN